MNAPITVTTTVAVWFVNTDYGNRPHDLIDALERGDAIQVINMLQFYGAPDREKFSDYTKIGEADITLRLISRDEQTRMALEALNAQLAKLRAAYMERQQEILAQISKLNAITYEEA